MWDPLSEAAEKCNNETYLSNIEINHWDPRNEAKILLLDFCSDWIKSIAELFLLSVLATIRKRERAHWLKLPPAMERELLVGASTGDRRRQDLYSDWKLPHSSSLFLRSLLPIRNREITWLEVSPATARPPAMTTFWSIPKVNHLCSFNSKNK